jgi:hypothetical protein
MIPAYGRRSSASSWKITASFAGLSGVPIAWDGATEEEVVESFLEFLTNDDAVRQLDPWAVPQAGWRRINVRFQGENKQVIFQSRWVSGFTVERGF